jgi:hypothetical protein
MASWARPNALAALEGGARLALLERGRTALVVEADDGEAAPPLRLVPPLPPALGAAPPTLRRARAGDPVAAFGGDVLAVLHLPHRRALQTTVLPTPIRCASATD